MLRMQVPPALFGGIYKNNYIIIYSPAHTTLRVLDFNPLRLFLIGLLALLCEDFIWHRGAEFGCYSYFPVSTRTLDYTRALSSSIHVLWPPSRGNVPKEGKATLHKTQYY